MSALHTWIAGLYSGKAACSHVHLLRLSSASPMRTAYSIWLGFQVCSEEAYDTLQHKSRMIELDLEALYAVLLSRATERSLSLPD